MLILTRKPDESFELEVLTHDTEYPDGRPELVTVRLLKIQGQQARIGIDAPTTIAIRRSELCDPTRSSTSAKRTGATSPPKTR